MKKSMCILIFSAVLLTGCVGTETMKSAIPEIATETVPVTETERTEAAVTTVMTARPLKTTVTTETVTTARIAKIALNLEIKEQIQTVTEGRYAATKQNTTRKQYRSPGSYV